VTRCRMPACRKQASYVTRLAESLRAQHPGKFVPPPLSLATLNWKAVLICAAIEAVVLGVLWIAMPPAYPAAAVVQFTLSLLFGMGLIAFGRVKGKRRRLFVAVVAIMSVGGPFMLSLLEAASYPSWLYFWGFFFGIFLMISAVTPRRRRGFRSVACLRSLIFLANPWAAHDNFTYWAGRIVPGRLFTNIAIRRFRR